MRENNFYKNKVGELTVQEAIVYQDSAVLGQAYKCKEIELMSHTYSQMVFYKATEENSILKTWARTTG